MASSAKSSFVVKHETVWTPVAEPGPGSCFKHPVYMTENEIVFLNRVILVFNDAHPMIGKYNLQENRSKLSSIFQKFG